MKQDIDLRKQITSELHDDLGPMLSIANMTLSTIIDENIHITPELRHIKNLIEESISIVRKISCDINSITISNIELEKAIYLYFSKVPSIIAPKFIFNYKLEDGILNNCQTKILYRIICEMILNCTKHAKCSTLYMSIIQKDEMIYVKYLDNGIGISDTTLADSQKKGLGFSNIESRINFLHSSPTLKTIRGKGSYASFSFKPELC